MLSTEDIQRFIENSRLQLEREKRKLDSRGGHNDEIINKDSGSSCGDTNTTLNYVRSKSAVADKRLSKNRVVTAKRSVSASPLRRKQSDNTDYSKELQIQIYPSDNEDENLLSGENLASRHSGGLLLDTVTAAARSNYDEDSQSVGVSCVSEKSTSDDIRQYCLKKLGGMLRTGEYSPNHPEMGLAGALPRSRGDVFVGLGLYEEKRRELMARRKREYREYLAKQKQLNALAKQKERLEIERNNNMYERQSQLYQQRANVTNNNLPDEDEQFSTRHNLQSFLSPAGGWQGEEVIDTLHRRPSSVAVQTDRDLLLMDQRPANSYLTQAERELSPRPINIKNMSQALQQMPSGHQLVPQRQSGQDPSDWKMLVEKVNIGTQNNLIMPPGQRDVTDKFLSPSTRDRDYEDGREYLDAINGMNSKVLFGKDSPRARLLQDLKHTYLPSLFDEDAIRQRNADMEKEAAAKRVSYQQELKQQIDEQHRLREERKAREKLLEEAETRRLEEQLKLLRLAHESEVEKQKQMAIRIKKDSNELERQRIKLQSDIDNEKKSLRQVKMKNHESESRTTRSESTAIKSDSKHSNLPFYYSAPGEDTVDFDSEIMSYNIRQNNRHLGQDPPPKRIPISSKFHEVPAIFAESIPVKNYNTNDLLSVPSEPEKLLYSEVPSNKFKQNETKLNTNKNNWGRNQRANYEPTFLSKNITEMIDTRNLVKNNSNAAKISTYEDSLPIPILREPENNRFNNKITDERDSKYSDAMKHVEDKWKVPAVQKNILKNNLNEDGKQENILTQLGAIRRQLQLEQLKLDQTQLLPSRMIK